MLHRGVLLNLVKQILEEAPVRQGIKIVSVMPINNDKLALVLRETDGTIVTLHLEVAVRAENQPQRGVENVALIGLDQLNYAIEKGFGIISPNGHGAVHMPAVSRENPYTLCGTKIKYGAHQWQIVQDEISCQNCLMALKIGKVME